MNKKIPRLGSEPRGMHYNRNKLACLKLTFTSALVQYVVVELIMELHYEGRLLALPTNIILEWKCMGVTNILAYFDRATITAALSFII